MHFECSRGFQSLTQEQDFSQTRGFYRTLEDN